MSQEKLSGQLEALLRQGAKDLHNAIVPAFPQSAHSLDEPGTPLNPTQQMVTNDVNADSGYQKWLESHAREAGQERGAGRELER
ncbi:MAG TPA: hypothetical protein VHZ24_15680 [Pirellulales bacterium]|jgi:hypothetical protein|nr:hypothetical protein [Pirellulales bacterium]